MEKNNFEKEVRQKMGELKIPPSDSVWTSVEKRINKKDKKRRPIFILFFLILFLLSGGYWLVNTLNNQHKENQQISKVITTEKESKSTPPDRIPVRPGHPGGSRAGNKADSSFEKSEIISHNNHVNNDSASISSDKFKSPKVNSPKKTEKRKEQKLKLIKELASMQKENYSKATNNEDSKFALNNESKLIQINPDKNEILFDNVMDSIQNKIDIGSLTNQLKTKNLIGKSIAINELSKNKDSTKPHKKHWNLGITFSGGASLIGSNILEKNYPSNLNVSFPSGGFPSNGNPSYYYNPSPIKNSTAFIAGIFIEKNLSAKSKISLGISYKYYSLVNNVGNKIDSALTSSQYLAINNFNNSAYRSHSYRNNFHYLEVPVSIKLPLNKNEKLPLFWNVGINISQLISSNALQFQSNPGIYYNDNSLFNKTQFGFSTGVSATLFSKQKVPVTIGPYFYYSASKLAGKGLYQNKHFSFIGIRTEILFRQK